MQHRPDEPGNDREHDATADIEPEVPERERQRLERAAAFHVAYADRPLTPPQVVCGLLLLAWWVLLGWQAAMWWPREDGPVQIAAGRAQVQTDAHGEISALLVGDGADAQRFECARRGRWQWQVLRVPVLECRDAAGLAQAQDRNVHVRYDMPAGGAPFRRMLALTVDGQPLWTRADSAEAFSWLLYRGAFAGLLLLVPGWFLRGVWRRRE
jgi:hypothetical protein